MQQPLPSPRKPLSGRRVLFMFLAFFCVFGSVDAYFVITALGTHPGVVTEHAYEKGLAYNQTLAAEKHFFEKGVHSQILYMNETKRLEWHLDESTDFSSVQLTMMRPSSDKDDKSFDLIRFDGTDSVRYYVFLKGLKKGRWIAKISAKFKGTDFVYLTNMELVIE